MSALDRYRQVTPSVPTNALDRYRLRNNQTGVVPERLPEAPLPEPRPNWFQYLMSPLIVSSVWSNQLFGSIERNLHAVRGVEGAKFGLPRFSTYEEAAMGQYPEEEDIGLAISGRVRMGGLNPLYAIEEVIRGPETDANQFITSGRAIVPDADYAFQYGQAINLARQIAAEYLPADHWFNLWPVQASLDVSQWGPALFNEQIVAETMNDPLWLVGAFGIGEKMVQGINRAAGTAREAVPLLDRGISSASNFANRVMTESWREIYRAARPILGEAGYQREVARGELEASEQAVRQAGGRTWQTGPFFQEEIAPRIQRLVEETPPETVTGIRVTAGTIGPEEAIEDIIEIVAREFPEVPPLAQHSIAEFLDRAWTLGKRLPEIENLHGIPTARLVGNLEYAQHIYTADARRAAYRSLPDWRQRNTYDFLNQLGKDITGTLHPRLFRSTITEANELARAGRLGFVDGKMTVLEIEEAESLIRPDHWQPVTKLFEDNPWAVLYSRYGQHTRAVASADMLRQAVRNPEFVMDPKATDYPRIPELIGDGVFQRTFGRLGGELEELARNTRWRDKETALGVLEWGMVARDVQQRPAAVLNMLDTAISTWRGLTLSPFLAYHNRNIVGGCLNALMSGECDILDIIDATFPTRGIGKLKGETAQYWEMFKRLGLHRTGEVKSSWSSSMTYLYDDPLLGTPIQSWWDIIRHYNPFGEGGRTVGAAIENHQRFAQFLGSMRRTRDDTHAAEMVYKYLFDYWDIPRWFRQGTVARRMSSFPTWTMKNIPLQFEHYVKTPTAFSIRGRLLNSVIRASGTANAPMPEYVSEQQGIPAPGGFLALENFDPAMGMGEVMQIAGPMMRGEWREAAGAVGDFINNLVNPFFTWPLEFAMGTAPVGSTGEPGGYAPTLDYTLPEVQHTGWDFFMQRPVYRDYTKWSEAWKVFGVEGEMPRWAQFGDHALRSFVRAYNELSSLIRKPEKATEQILGIPFRPMGKAASDQTIYFSVRNGRRDIAAAQGQINNDTATPEQISELKDLYMAQLGYLSHGTFLQLDPFEGTPRPWLSVARQGDFTLMGQQKYWRDYIETCYLLLYGRRGMGTQDIHQPIPLDPTEQEFIEGLMNAAIQSYIAVMSSYAASGEEGINPQAELGYIGNRMNPPGE